MATENKPLISDKLHALREMARYLSKRLRGRSPMPMGELLTAYKGAGAFRRALIDSLTAADIHRLCDTAIGLDKRSAPQRH